MKEIVYDISLKPEQSKVDCYREAITKVLETEPVVVEVSAGTLPILGLSGLFTRTETMEMYDNYLAGFIAGAIPVICTGDAIERTLVSYPAQSEKTMFTFTY